MPAYLGVCRLQRHDRMRHHRPPAQHALPAAGEHPCVEPAPQLAPAGLLRAWPPCRAIRHAAGAILNAQTPKPRPQSQKTAFPDSRSSKACSAVRFIFQVAFASLDLRMRGAENPHEGLAALQPQTLCHLSATSWNIVGRRPAVGISPLQLNRSVAACQRVLVGLARDLSLTLPGSVAAAGTAHQVYQPTAHLGKASRQAAHRGGASRGPVGRGALATWVSPRSGVETVQ